MLIRQHWIEQHQRWVQRQWAEVLFTNESRFHFSSNDGLYVYANDEMSGIQIIIREADIHGKWERHPQPQTR